MNSNMLPKMQKGEAALEPVDEIAGYKEENVGGPC